MIALVACALALASAAAGSSPPRLNCQSAVLTTDAAGEDIHFCDTVMPACPHPAPTDPILAATAVVEVSSTQRSFAYPQGAKRQVNGHIVRLRAHGAQSLDAGRFVSVLPPVNRCKTSHPASLRTVAAAAREYAHEMATVMVIRGVRTRVRSIVKGCRLAVNAGLFHTADGACTSTVVSNGDIVHTSTSRVPYFGVLASRGYAASEATCQSSRGPGNAFMMGYLTDDDLKALKAAKERPFRSPSPGAATKRRSHDYRQLVGGLGMLVRDGVNFMSTGIPLQQEDAAAQETGTLANFAATVSARTAVGVTRGGDVVIAQVDGRSWWNGLDLTKFADWLTSMRFPGGDETDGDDDDDVILHAMNLDGGGSATMVRDGVVINTPSYACNESDSVSGGAAWADANEAVLKASGVRCERPVSSVLCMHDLPVVPTVDADGRLVVQHGCACTRARGTEDDADALLRLASMVTIRRWRESHRRLRQEAQPGMHRRQVAADVQTDRELMCICSHAVGEEAYATLEGVRTRVAVELYVVE